MQLLSMMILHDNPICPFGASRTSRDQQVTSPEQVQGLANIGAKADQYAVAAIA